MTRERWERIKTMIDEAERAPASERAAILDRLCAGDLELRGEVERLMKDEGSDFIQAAIGNAAAELMEDRADAAGQAYTGRRIGCYKLSDLIGSGGMGSVYRGVRDDREFEQQVAVKFLRSGTGDTLKERFRQERQTLARLSHPHIARILDGGTTGEGIPYFVMEYIDGEPVTSYCRTHDLTLATRVELFLHICAAVDYANQKGVVHRDLKPSNILVTPEGLPKLLDFGIAKNVAIPAESELTAQGVIVGSINYLSPEQARGEPVDARSDVFSLGVILYELLTGVQPFARPIATDTLAAILVGNPARPGQLKAGIPRELDAVVGRALAKSRDARYSTAGEMLAVLKAIHLDVAAKARRGPRLKRLGIWAGILATAIALTLLLWRPW